MLLALLAMQAVMLDADPARAALACAHASAADVGTQANALRFTSQYYYFLTASAIATPGSASVTARTDAASAAEGKLPPLTHEAAAAALVACDLRFPLARRTGVAALPADPFKRDTLCAATLGMAVGGIIGANGKDSTDEKRLRPILDAYVGRLSDVRLALEGYASDPKVDALFATTLESSISSANLEMVVTACARELGK